LRVRQTLPLSGSKPGLPNGGFHAAHRACLSGQRGRERRRTDWLGVPVALAGLLLADAGDQQVPGGGVLRVRGTIPP